MLLHGPNAVSVEFAFQIVCEFVMLFLTFNSHLFKCLYLSGFHFSLSFKLLVTVHLDKTGHYEKIKRVIEERLK